MGLVCTWVFITSTGGGEKDIVGLGCVCLQKMVGSSVGMDSF